jgi:hypothetical protein
MLSKVLNPGMCNILGTCAILEVTLRGRVLEVEGLIYIS